MKQLERHEELRLSERSVLRPGVRFRATGGPQWRLSDGTLINMAARGPFLFRCYWTRGAYSHVEATDRTGATAILHLTGRREQIDPSLIPRPYKIKSTIRKKKGRQPCSTVTGLACKKRKPKSFGS
jgi:hypothetical protein